jgi:hypothetical protein
MTTALTVTEKRIRVTLCDNILEPDTWMTYETDNLCAFLIAKYGAQFPDSGCIYHNSVSEQNNVTPHDEASVAKLEALRGHFFIVVWPEISLTILLIVAVAIAAIAVGLAFLLRPSTPPTQEHSPNNDLTDRENRARPNERIPDIVGTVRSTPDLLAQPYKIFIPGSNLEVEYSFMCIGRGSYTLGDCKDDTTDLGDVDGEFVAVYDPYTSPNGQNADSSLWTSDASYPAATFGTNPGASIPPVVSIQSCSGVNGQILRAPNSGVLETNNNVQFSYATGSGVITNDGSIDFTDYFVAPTLAMPITQLQIFTNDDGINASDPAGIVHSVGLAGVYDIASVTATTIVLTGANAVNGNWSIVATFAGGTSTFYHTFEMLNLSTLSIGPFALQIADMTEVWCNFVEPNGLYYIDTGGNQHSITVTVQITVQAIDANNNPIGDPITGTVNLNGSNNLQQQVGSTLKFVLPSPGPVQVTALLITPMDTGTQNVYSQQIQWRDLFGVSPVPVTDFGNVTTLMAIATPTQDALSIKKRKINLLVTRNIPTWIDRSKYGVSYAIGATRPLPPTPPSPPGGGPPPIPIPELYYAGTTGSTLYDVAGTTTPVEIVVAVQGPSGGSSTTGTEVTIKIALGYGALSLSSAGTSPAQELTVASTHPYGIIGAGSGSYSQIVVWFIPNGTTPVGIYSEVFEVTSETDSRDYGNVTVPVPATLQLTASGGTPPLPPQPGEAVFGNIGPSNNAADIICFLALDPYVGRRTSAELNVAEIYATADAAFLGGEHVDGQIVTYFGGSSIGAFLCAEFCYTFDDSKVSFEESLANIAQFLACTAYRAGSSIGIFFEQATDASTLLFNHRNKIPDSETRTVTFGTVNDNDGIELDYIDPNAPNFPNIDTTETLYFPIDQSAQNPKKIQSIGIRNSVQATLIGWRLYQKLIYQNTQTEFECTQEAAPLILRQRIAVVDGTRDDVIDGEITGVSGLVITTSQPLNYATYGAKLGVSASVVATFAWTIFLQLYDGSIQAIAVTRPSGLADNEWLLGTTPTLDLVSDSSTWARTTYQLVWEPAFDITFDGLTTAANIQRNPAFLLASKVPENKNTYKLSAVNYDSNYYAHDADFSSAIILAPSQGYGPQGYTGSGTLDMTLTPVSGIGTGFDVSTYTGSMLDTSNNVATPLVTAGHVGAQIDLLALGGSVKTYASDYAIQPNDATIRADAGGGVFTLLLPLEPTDGMVLYIKKIDSTSNAVTIDGNGHNIDGSATKTLTTQWQYLQLQYTVHDHTWGVY